MAELIDPAPLTTIYDPACGSGGLLIKARLLFEGTIRTYVRRRRSSTGRS